MAMGRPKAVLVLDAELREQLENLANSRSLPAGLVRRAKVTVRLWRCRFLRRRVSGLYDGSIVSGERVTSEESS
jgi:hypothetical protein